MTIIQDSIGKSLSLIDWRSEMAALYHKVSESRSLADIWPFFVAERKRLYATHAQSPLRENKSISFFDYDPSLSMEVSLTPVEENVSHALDGGNDGLINVQAFALTSGLAPQFGKELTLYQLNQYGGGLF